MTHGGYIPESDSSPLIDDRPTLPLWRLAFVSICFCGVQFGWALQTALLTPFFLVIGLPKSLVTLVWLCGPVAGLIVQPIVGVHSDRCESRFGRRRPYILAGTVFIVIALLLIPNSLDIGRLLGDTIEHKPAAITLSVIGFWILDISNNLLQGPCRALIVDVAPHHQQELGNSLFSAWLGLGNVLGYLAGFAPWSEYFSFMQTKFCEDACTNMRVAFAISVILLCITIALTLFGVKEKQYSRPTVAAEKSNLFVKIFLSIARLSPPMKRIVTVQFFSWFAWFAFMIYITDWVGENVFQGSPDVLAPNHQAYVDGTRYGSFGLALYALTCILTSFALPRLIPLLGSKIVWSVAQVILALCLGFTYLVSHFHSKVGSIILIGLFGIPFAVTLTIPYALTAQVSPPHDRGLYMGVLNIFIVLPQFVMSGVGSLLIFLFKGNVLSTLIAGAISSLISALLVFRLITVDPKATNEKYMNVESNETQSDHEDHKGNNDNDIVVVYSDIKEEGLIE